MTTELTTIERTRLEDVAGGFLLAELQKELNKYEAGSRDRCFMLGPLTRVADERSSDPHVGTSAANAAKLFREEYRLLCKNPK